MVKICVFSAGPYVRKAFCDLLTYDVIYVDDRCTMSTAQLCHGCDVVCLFVSDECSREIVAIFKANGVKLITLRCRGFTNVDQDACRDAGIPVMRVPQYSEHAVAEHALALTMTLNRRLHRCHNRVREGNFTLNGLIGVDLHGKTAGIIGTGRIGFATSRLFKALGMTVLGVDPNPRQDFAQIGTYVALDELLACSDVVSLHVPVASDTHQMVNDDFIGKMKRGAILINVAMGGLIDTQALIRGIRGGQISAAGLDVYEEEAGYPLFSRDLSQLQDDERMLNWDVQFAELRGFPNVIISPHSAFLTVEACEVIAQTTIRGVKEFEEGKPLTCVLPGTVREDLRARFLPA
jgi:D-lactate dehydrogenase